MSWKEFHGQSESLASAAEVSMLNNDLEQARDLYYQAAEAELRALDSVDDAKQRTLGITAVSAVALYYKASAYTEAERLAYRSLQMPNMPTFAAKQLQDLLRAIWSDSALERGPVRFVPGDVLVSVSGGEIVHGGAPLDVIVRKVSEVEKLFYRTAEYLLGRPHRVRGEPEGDVREMVRPWLFQAAPGSYQFMVRVEEPRQTDLFADSLPQISEVARTFLSIVRASAEDPEGALVQIVPDAHYRSTFLKMTRNLAPTGRSFERISLRDATESQARAISLSSPIRSVINETLRKQRQGETDEALEIREVRGVLRALHLDQQWLEVTDVADPSSHVRIVRTSEVLDDIVGPMVNHVVVVEVLVDRGGRHVFKDIQLEE